MARCQNQVQRPVMRGMQWKTFTAGGMAMARNRRDSKIERRSQLKTYT